MYISKIVTIFKEHGWILHRHFRRFGLSYPVVEAGFEGALPLAPGRDDREEADVEELLVEGEAPEGSVRIVAEFVSDENEEESDGLLSRNLGISTLFITDVCSPLLFNAFWIISMVHTACWVHEAGEDLPPAAKFRSSSKLLETSATTPGLILVELLWRSLRCRLQSLLLPFGKLEGSRQLMGRGLPEEEDVEQPAFKLSCRSVSDFLLPRNSYGKSCSVWSSTSGSCRTWILFPRFRCFRGSLKLFTPELLLT